MKFESDSSGFLVGKRLAGGQAERMLIGIKGDTRRILEAMRSIGAARGGAGSRAPMGASYSAAISPGGRAVATARALAKDATTGRFVSTQRSAQPTASEQRMTRSAQVSARAAQVMANATQAKRRDDKARAAAQARDPDGRFGGGGRGGGGGGGAGGGVGSALAQAGGSAISGTEQIDPLLGAANEVKSLFGAIKGVGSPLWGAAKGLFGRKKNTDEEQEQVEQTGWLKKIWKRLRNQGGGEGGGFLSSILGFLPAILPAVVAALPAVLGAGGLAILAAFKPTIDGWVTDLAQKANAALKGTPIIGDAVRAIEKYRDRDKPLKVDIPGREGELRTAANRAGSSQELVLAMDRAETGGMANPATAKNGSSSAYGTGQITDGTWLGAMRKYGGNQEGAGKYLDMDTSGMTKEEAAKYRDDPAMQQAMFGHLVGEAEGNARRFARGAKVPYEMAQSRAMYMLGGTDGKSFLSAMQADPSALASSVLPAGVVSANKSIFGGTVGEAYARMQRDMMIGKMARGSGIATMANPFKATIQQSPSLPLLGSIRPPSMPSIGAMPAIDAAGSGRIGSSPPPVVRVDATPNLGQDVCDRDIAHICTGGIGNARSRR